MSANCLAQNVLFQSGISFGSGKTTYLEKEECHGITYLDTIRLADVKLR